MPIVRNPIENNEKIKEKINRYEIAYYKVLRNLISKYEQLLEFYPKGNKIVVKLGKNGVVVIHYPSSQDSFDFILSGDMVQDIIPMRISLDKKSVGFNLTLSD